MKEFTFQPDFAQGCIISNTNKRIEEIKNEPMLFSSSIGFAYKNSGPLTEAILDTLIPYAGVDWLDNPVIDTRVHMLMPGMYPAIPGWHCDAVRRNNGQPDLENDDSMSDRYHFTCLFESDSDIAPTEFLREEVTVKYDPERVWKSVSEEISKLPNPETSFIKAGYLYIFSSTQLHRATPATKRGWRYFFRLSDYPNLPRNEVRKQAQVYVVDEHGGW